MRVVIDTNVIISSFLVEGSLPAKTIDRILADHTLVISESIIDEVTRVVTRKKFRKYLTEELAVKLLQELVERSDFTEINTSIVMCRDPKDNHILETAVSGDAKMIICGDGDLLSLHPFMGISILRPKTFMDL
jgi:putative PIN family toxin of toxin-antitoxin system